MKTTGLQFRFLLVVAGFLAVAMAASVISLFRVYDSTQDLDRISREDFDSQQSILQATVNLKVQVQEFKNVLLRGDDAASFEKYWKAFEAAEKATEGEVRQAKAATPHREVRDQLEKFLGEHKAAGEAYRRGIEVFRGNRADPRAGDKAVAGIDRRPTETILEAGKTARDLGADAVTRAVKGAESALRFAIAITVVVIILVILAVWYFVRRAVLLPIEAAVGHADRIARGDLTADIRSSSRDETGQLLRSLAAMNGSLAQVVSRVRNSAEAVVSAARQVAVGTTEMSQRTEEQASSLEETAASMEELSSTVKQNAENARQADELARNASQRAQQGGAEVVRAVLTMSGISDSARKIGDIISVIDAIAFQTNILALNAAVEAARAGEQGRGFAVVAAEVRTLAQRSAQAAKEIKGLVADSVATVATGTQVIEQAGDTIQALVVDVQRVSDLMRSIAEASSEQSRGVQQVNRTVTEMDKVVQQNASVVQESMAAAESMRQQAGSLLQAVGAFRISREDAGVPAPDRAGGGSSAGAPAVGTMPGPRPALAGARTAVGTRSASADDDWEQF
jgi:methyl-accepting chemotaxis protein